jgi:hypothetical protein
VIGDGKKDRSLRGAVSDSVDRGLVLDKDLQVNVNFAVVEGLSADNAL